MSNHQHDLSEQLAHLTGEDFIIALRAFALLASAADGKMRCAGCGDHAVLIGMQRCGAPGGPICMECCALHFAWIRAWDKVEEAIPTCRHCDADIDKTHIYAVSLFDPNLPEVSP